MGPIERAELAEKYTARPAVDGDVMGRDQQQMIVVGERKQSKAPERPLA